MARDGLMSPENAVGLYISHTGILREINKPLIGKCLIAHIFIPTLCSVYICLIIKTVSAQQSSSATYLCLCDRVERFKTILQPTNIPHTPHRVYGASTFCRSHLYHGAVNLL